MLFRSKVISFYVEPIGSTATIIAKQFLQDKTVELPKDIAGILLSAILSDTVIFRSPTTTREDVLIAQNLAEVAEIKDIEAFGVEMKSKKSSLKGLEAKNIILSDFKEYEFKNKKIGVGQIEVTSLEETELRKEELLKSIKEISKKMKSALACGGTVKGNTIELQGDHKKRAKEELIKYGFPKEIGRASCRERV